MRCKRFVESGMLADVGRSGREEPKLLIATTGRSQALLSGIKNTYE
jgi:hypothetical protein